MCIRDSSYSAETNQSGCSWGNGQAAFTGFMNRKYRQGGLTTDSLGTVFTCPEQIDFMENRLSYSHEGPNRPDNGSITLYTCRAGAGNWPLLHSDWVWNNMGELPGLNGTPLTFSTLFTDVQDATCQKGRPFGIGYDLGTAAYRGQLAFKSYSWFFASTLSVPTSAQLHLCCSGYYEASADKLVDFPGALFAPRKWHKFADVDGVQVELPLGGSDKPTKAHIIWDVTYPCGNPETLTLTYNAAGSLLGYLAGTTFPTTVTIRRMP